MDSIGQVHVTLLGARHVPERHCGGHVYLRRYIKCSTFTFLPKTVVEVYWYIEVYISHTVEMMTVQFITHIDISSIDHET